MGCGASIRFYKSQKPNVNIIKITCVNLTHNHAVSKEIHESQNIVFTDEQEELVKTLKSACAKPSQIRRVLFDQFGKKELEISLKVIATEVFK